MYSIVLFEIDAFFSSLKKCYQIKALLKFLNHLDPKYSCLCSEYCLLGWMFNLGKLGSGGGSEKLSQISPAVGNRISQILKIVLKFMFMDMT